jgi:hypothetical protein
MKVDGRPNVIHMAALHIHRLEVLDGLPSCASH